MLWPILQLFFVMAVVFTVFSYLNSVNPLGQVILKLFSMLLWVSSGIALFKIRFMAGGSVGMVFYDFTLGSAATAVGIVYLFGCFGLVQGALGFWQAWEIVIRGNVSGWNEFHGREVEHSLKEF